MTCRRATTFALLSAHLLTAASAGAADKKAIEQPTTFELIVNFEDSEGARTDAPTVVPATCRSDH